MLTIISPAKKLNLDCSFNKDNISYPEFQQETFDLVNILKSKSVQALKDLMHISDNLAELNFKRNQDFTNNFNLENSYPAAKLFNGEVYNGLDIDSFNDDDQAFAQNHLRILSGLYGILRPLDLIQPYRLEMGSKLTNSKGPNLYKFWQDLITEKINTELGSHKSPYLLNLASNEYAKVIDFKNLNKPVISINFKDLINGNLKSIMMYAKAARGAMANSIIKNKIDTIELLKELVINDYRFSQEHSISDSELIFTRTN
ncbi:MAG: peroxide stress protein YaaA [Rickettsiales bacterium]|jgi:uncharacterized protein|nr:peroxide stress protein YaaA [Rickettsiales bacterium]